MKKFTDGELKAAKAVVKEWQASGDINLLAWLDYNLRMNKALGSRPNTLKSTAKTAVVKARKRVVKSKTVKK